MKKVLLIPILCLFTFASFSQCFPDRHNTSTSASWQSCVKTANPNTARGESHWLSYDLGQFYTLGTTKLWNLNIPEKTNEGVRNLVFDISIDGTNWTEIANFEMPQASGSTFYEGVIGPDLDGISTRYVLITIIDSWSESECVGLGEVRFNIEKPIITDLTKQDVKCHDSADGVATLNAQGGVEPFDVVWSNGETGTEITDLEVGTYYVSITDQLNNIVVDSITIDAPEEIVLSLESILHIDCDNEFGSIEVTAIGGTGELRYEWSNGDVGPILNDAIEGVYELTVFDENECEKSQSFEITADSAVPNAVAQAPSLNCKNNEVIIDATASSSGENFEYVWTTEDGNIVSGENSLNPVVNAAGVYSLEITNTQNQCKGNTEVTVINIPDVDIELVSSQNVACTGESNGEIEINAFDGQEPYIFEWSNGASGNTQTNLPAGVYTITVTDGFDCESSLEIEITEPTELSLELLNQVNIDCEINTGSISVEGSGGTGNLIYQWSNGDSGAELNNLSAGEITLTIIDENQCALENTFTISADVEKPEVVLNSGILYCSVNEVELDGTGSSTGDNFSYAWTSTDGTVLSGENQIIATTNQEGTYQLQVTNQDNHCEETMSIEVIRIPDVEIALNETQDVLCHSEQNGVAEVMANLGQEPYNYFWSHGEEGARLEDLSAGNYTVTVVDDLACTQELSLSINEPQALSMVVDSASYSSFDIAEGFINISVEGGTQPLSFTWMDSDGNIVSEEEDPSDLFPGVYTLTITDANDCIFYSEEITIQGISSTNDLQGNALLVYPNPAKNRLNISLENKELVGKITVVIENSIGQKVYQGSMFQHETKQVNVENFAAGSYILRLSTDADYASIIFIKE